MIQQPTQEKKCLFNRDSSGRRKMNINVRNRSGIDGEKVFVNGLGRFYNKIVNFSIITRYFVYVLPVAILLAAPIVVCAVQNPHAIFANTGIRVTLFWLWIEIVWLSIWVSKLVAKVVPWMFMFLCGVVSSGTRKYVLILRAVEIPLSLVGWSVTCLVTFTALMSPKLNGGIPSGYWVTVMARVLGPCLIASLLLLGEKLAVQLISVNYHRRTFKGRITQSKRDVYLMGLLYEASRTLFPLYCQEFIDEDYIINNSTEPTLAETRRHYRRSDSATHLKLISDVGRLGDKVTSIFGNIASEITGMQVFSPDSAQSIDFLEALKKTRSSEALARRIWMSFVVEGKEALYAEDVREVLGSAYKEEADESFAALDQDENGDISLNEMIMKVVEIGRDREAVSASMRDVGQAIGVLDRVLTMVLLIITLFIFVAFQNTNFVTTLATAGTTLLSLSFVFAATTQEFLASCIFLFVKHPFDVGDRVDIIGPEKEFLVVEQISLLFTVFKRIDSMKMVQVPNIVLNNLWIENITRSRAMKEQLDLFISFDTSLEDIDLLRKEMENFVRNPDNSRDFQSDIVLEATGIGNMDKMQLKVEIRHKSNWHNETVRAARRSKFMCALVLALRKVPIYCPGGGAEPLGGPTNPGYSVTVSDTWAADARDKVSQAKEDQRLVPSKATESSLSPSGSLGPAEERKATEAMNARKPIADAAQDAEDAAPVVWKSRDDNTLGETPKGHRTNEIDTMREGHQRSIRGRRRPGKSLPPMSSQGIPGVTLTQANSNQGDETISSVSQTSYEEVELGLQPITTNQSHYDGYTVYQSQRYGMYASPSAGSAGT